MRYIKQYIETIAGIEIYPLVSLGIFFLFFIGLLVYVLRMNKKDADLMASMPLENETE